MVPRRGLGRRRGKAAEKKRQQMSKDASRGVGEPNLKREE